jgi:very-short-patch-repair endonuclease
MECKICGKVCKNALGLNAHITKLHKINSKDYFVKYILNGVAPVCYCGKELKFININKGFQTYCSLKCSASSPEVRENYKKTCLIRFGEETPARNKEIQEKKKETCKKKYGEEYAFQSEEVKEKIRETNNERYGADCSFQNAEVREKYRINMQNKYGVENPSQLPWVLEKMKETWLKLYNVENPFLLEKTLINSKKINEENAKNVFSEMGFEIVSKYIGCRELTKFKCKKCNSEFEDILCNVYQRQHKCPVCDPIFVSHLELEVREEIVKHLIYKFKKQPEIIYNDRTILSPLEIDILIPKIKLSVEVNGDYWHSLPGIPERDNFKKDEMISKGFKHLIIKESEWHDNKQTVLNKFDQILKISFKTYLENQSNFTGV